MNRRIVCQRTGAVALLSLPGCLGGGTGGRSNDDDSEPNDSEADDTTTDDTRTNDTETNETAADSESDVVDSDQIAASTLTRTGDCSETGTATVTFGDDDPEAAVSGCLTGHNGCAEPVVDSLTETDDGVRIVMGEADLSDAETACTEALVQRGYELHLEFSTELPSTIEIVHDDVDGREVVATADRP
ncbi:MAG: hypothetical protein ACOCP2_02205 [Halohasta sp.]